MKKIMLMAAALLMSGQAYAANWSLVNEASSLHFISVKKSTVAEVHDFNTLHGTVDEEGHVALKVDLSSVDTHVDVRNERMKNMLFDIVSFPAAEIAGVVDMKKVSTMQSGDRAIQRIQLQLSLHGISHEVTADVRVVKLSQQRFLVASLKPIIIKASDFQLLAGIEKLRQVAKLPSISTAVPVTFSLIFRHPS